MIKAITLRTFPQEMPWKDCMAEAAAAGYQGVEINFDGRFDLECPQGMLKDISRQADATGLRVTSVYSRQQWWTPISSRDLEKRRQGTTALLRLMEIAEALKAETILVIPGAVDNSILAAAVEVVPYDEVYKRTQDVLGGLAVQAERKGVVLALENVPGKFLLSPLEMAAFIDQIGSPAVGCYFDVANCLYDRGYPEQWIDILGERIRNIHLKDYRTASGNLTGFVNIFEGDVNWPQVCDSLVCLGYDGVLTSEVLPTYRYHPECLWKSVSDAMDRLITDIGDREVRPLNI